MSGTGVREIAVGVGAAGVASVMKARGCPVLDIQPAQTHQLQGTAKPISQDVGTSDKMHLRKYKNTIHAEEEGTKRVRNSRGNTKVRRGGEEEGGS